MIRNLIFLIFIVSFAKSNFIYDERSATQQRNYRFCGRTLFTGFKGFIASHLDFGRRMYPRNHECIWRILTPPGTRVMLFPSVMSLEYEDKCRFDKLEVFDGTNTTARRLGALCGGNIEALFISSGPRLTLRFQTDSTISKEGFSLRYVTFPASTRAPGGYQLSRSDRNCTNREVKCGNGLCTPRAVVCDQFDDCGDQSDEFNCVHAKNGSCGPAFFKCGRFGKCIPNYMKCDGYIDCWNSEDEYYCGADGILAQTNDTDEFDPTEFPRASCGKSSIQPAADQGRIVGGQVARKGSWPWMVSLHNNGGHVCGGSIISKRWILTASHCVEGSRNPRSWKVYAGLHRQGRSGRRTQVSRVSRIKVHPRWNSEAINYDLTLMRLSRRLKWTRYVRPICLPTKKVSSSARCFIAGWGETKGTGGAGRLKQGSVRTFSNRQCNEWYRGGITSKMVCAGRREGGVDSCQGDSGGPLMCKDRGKFVLHGVTSFGGDCGAPNSPGVYARVSSMLNWVKQSVGLSRG